MVFPDYKLNLSDREALNKIAKGFFGSASEVASGVITANSNTTYNSYSDNLGLSIFISAISGTSPTITVNVYPIDSAGNILDSATVLTATLSAVGNVYVTATDTPFRAFKVEVVVGGTTPSITGVVNIYG